MSNAETIKQIEADFQALGVPQADVLVQWEGDDETTGFCGSWGRFKKGANLTVCPYVKIYIRGQFWRFYSAEEGVLMFVK